MTDVAGATIRATFPTRRQADLAVEQLVQQLGVEQTDIFVTPEPGKAGPLVVDRARRYAAGGRTDRDKYYRDARHTGSKHQRFARRDAS